METTTTVRKVSIFVIATLVLSLLGVICLSAAPQSAQAATPAKVKLSKVTVASNVVTLKWKKAKGAKKYQIYRATSKSGKYTYVKSTTKLKTTDSKAKGTSWYKVRAASGSKRGAFSSKKVIYKLSSKIISSTSTSTGTIFNVLITNPSKKSRVYFWPGTNYSRIYVMNKKSGKVVQQYTSLLVDANGNACYTRYVSPGKSALIQVKAFYSQVSVPSGCVVAVGTFFSTTQKGTILYALLSGEKTGYTNIVRNR